MTGSLADRTQRQRSRGNGSVAGGTDLGIAVPSSYADGIGATAEAQGDDLASLTARLDRLTQEVSEARQRSEQLRAVLDKRTRRVQQLLGERDRLTSLLTERDAELQRLNREIGALTERATPATTDGSPGLLKAARAVLERVRTARDAPRPTRTRQAQPSTTQHASPRGALVPWVQNGPPKAVLAVVAFGLSQPEIEQVLAAIETNCAERDLAPLLLTDNDAFDVFRGRRVLFEYLPAPSDQERFAPELDWRLYTLRRLALIRRKWQPARVVAFGSRAAEVVKLWRDSPFEVAPIPAALNGSSVEAEPARAAPQPSAV